MSGDDREQQSAEALEALLNGAGYQCSFQRGDEQGDQFPDFIFNVQIGDQTMRWAVEETTLHAQFGTIQDRRPAVSYTRPWEAMIVRLKAVAASVNRVGYEFDVFRAIAPCSGDLQVIPHKDTYTEPLPIMAFHGDKDDFVTTARGRAARDKYLARNKCGTTTAPASPSPCVEYQGCAAPTFWCEFSGGHAPWSEEPKAIWKFFSQF